MYDDKARLDMGLIAKYEIAFRAPEWKFKAPQEEMIALIELAKDGFLRRHAPHHRQYPFIHWSPDAPKESA